MNYPLPSRNARRRGFTLIEMLVVIAIITILAGLVIPLAGIAAKKKKISQAQSQISAIQVAIGQYKNKKGFYPPDNPNSAGQNQLVYELAGAKVDSATGNFIDSLKNTTITPLNMTAIFSAGGIVNSSADPSDVSRWNNQIALAEADDQASQHGSGSDMGLRQSHRGAGVRKFAGGWWRLRQSHSL